MQFRRFLRQPFFLMGNCVVRRKDSKFAKQIRKANLQAPLAALTVTFLLCAVCFAVGIPAMNRRQI